MSSEPNSTRRDFFKAIGISAASVFLPGCKPADKGILSDLPVHRLDLASGENRNQAPVDRNNRSKKSPSVPSEWKVTGRTRAWRHVVIHHSATEVGSAEIFDAAHRNRGWDELGYHFVISNGNGGPNGKVEVGSRWKKQKWGAHCGGTPNNEYNNYGIGICLVGNFQNHMPSASQLSALKRLVSYLVDEYDIPLSEVVGHRDAPNASTACPGRMLHSYLHGDFKREIAETSAEAR